MKRRLGFAVLAAACAASAPLAHITPAAAQTCAPLKQIALFKMTKADNGQWLVPVGINVGTIAVPSTMLLSTATATSSISADGADAAKIPRMEKRNNKLFPSTGKGPEFVTLDALILGTGKFTDSEFPVSSKTPSGTTLPAGAAGILGLDLLTHFDFDIDLASGTLSLFDQNHCDGQVVYWKTNAAFAIPFVWDVGNKLKFPVTVDDQPVDATLDTTSDVNKITLANAKSLLKFDETAAAADKQPDDADGAQIWRHHFKNIVFEGVGIGNPSVDVVLPKYVPNQAQANAGGGRGPAIQRTPEEKKPAELTIGLGTMSKFHIYVAAKEKKLYISPAAQ